MLCNSYAEDTAARPVLLRQCRNCNEKLVRLLPDQHCRRLCTALLSMEANEAPPPWWMHLLRVLLSGGEHQSADSPRRDMTYTFSRRSSEALHHTIAPLSVNYDGRPPIISMHITAVVGRPSSSCACMHACMMMPPMTMNAGEMSIICGTAYDTATSGTSSPPTKSSAIPLY